MIWPDTKSLEVLGHLRRQALIGHELIALARAMASGRNKTDTRRLLASYVKGVCSFEDHLQYQIRDAINEVGVREGIISSGGTFFDDTLGVNKEFLCALRPDLVRDLYSVRNNSGLDQIPLLEPTINELADNTLPGPMNMLLHRADRPPVHAYSSRDASLYLHPFQYQVLSKDQTAMWRSGSPRSLSRAAIGRPDIVAVDRDIVVLQDRFNATNFAHFLFDSITRALLLRERAGTLYSPIFVFGGVPGQFHELVSRIFIDSLKLDQNSIYFPSRPIIFQSNRRCFWFSDQVEAYLHPAQMAHPTSINLLNSITQAAPGAISDKHRIYVSRADAHQRRVANEDHIISMLAQRGFVTVQLSTLSASQQIGLFRHADVIVAPHGMGLAHLAFAERLSRIVELFPPNAGTDAYALIAKARGFDYRFVAGRAVYGSASDFTVDADEISSEIDDIAGV